MKTMNQPFALCIHGGAGTLTRASMTSLQEHDYLLALKDALQDGTTILEAGGTAEDAVIAAITSLENCPLFNAGRGSVYTHEGLHEMDASIMIGTTLEAGAVSGVRNIKNPILAARDVMKYSEHVFLMGEGAEKFARERNLDFMPNEYFDTALRYDQWQLALADGRVALDHNIQTEKKFGTVGAVARDRLGRLAAGTSTGGMTNKQWGRVGDSPVIGSGTYANDKTCAISCTGHGEYFLRGVVAYDVSCLMEYKGLSLEAACKEVIMHKQVELGGEGGLIGISKTGTPCLVFNSEGMYRGSIVEGEETQTAIYG